MRPSFDSPVTHPQKLIMSPTTSWRDLPVAEEAAITAEMLGLTPRGEAFLNAQTSPTD